MVMKRCIQEKYVIKLYTYILCLHYITHVILALYIMLYTCYTYVTHVILMLYIMLYFYNV